MPLSFQDPTDPTGNRVWKEDEDGGNILVNTVTGETVKRVKPIYLPDGTLMKTMTLFRVEAAKDFYAGDHLLVKKGNFLIARRYPHGKVYLFTNSTTPFLLQIEARRKDDYNFIADLNKFKDSDLKVKLNRVLDIENYEYAVLIRDELKKRGIPIAS